MPAKQTDDPLILHVPAGATDAEILALAKAQFTADDFQRVTEMGPLFPMEDLLVEFERIST